MRESICEIAVPRCMLTGHLCRTRRLRGLLLGFTARHTVTCLVLHTPTLLEPTFSEARRRNVHPALYFAIASIAVVDHEMDRCVLVALSSATSRLTLRQARADHGRRRGGERRDACPV